MSKDLRCFEYEERKALYYKLNTVQYWIEEMLKEGLINDKWEWMKESQDILKNVKEQLY